MEKLCINGFFIIRFPITSSLDRFKMTILEQNIAKFYEKYHVLVSTTALDFDLSENPYIKLGKLI